MAKAKDVFVCIGKMAAKKSELDPKGAMSSVMSKTATRVVSKAKGVTSKSADKQGYEISGTLADLSKTEKGNKFTISCKISLVIAELPKKKIVAAGESSASLQGSAKNSARDVEACVVAVTEHATQDALKKILTLAKK